MENPQWRMISEETKGIIDGLLLEKLPLAGIAREEQISQFWVMQYVNQKGALELTVIFLPNQKNKLIRALESCQS